MEQNARKTWKLGFHPDPFGHAICSYKYKDIPVDIMSSKDDDFGPSNRWYEVGFGNLQLINALGEDIFILPTPIYLATKFKASPLSTAEALA